MGLIDRPSRLGLATRRKECYLRKLTLQVQELVVSPIGECLHGSVLYYVSMNLQRSSQKSDRLLIVVWVDLLMMEEDLFKQ